MLAHGAATDDSAGRHADTQLNSCAKITTAMRAVLLVLISCSLCVYIAFSSFSLRACAMQWSRVPASPGGYIGEDTPGDTYAGGSVVNSPLSPSELEEFSALHLKRGRVGTGLEGHVAAAMAGGAFEAEDEEGEGDLDAGVFDPRQRVLSQPEHNHFRLSSRWRRLPCCRMLSPLLRAVPRLHVWQLLQLGFPNALGLLTSSALSAVNLAFVGHLGDESQLAGAALGNSFMNLSGYAVILGLASAVDTLCAQSFGAGQKQLVGLVAQRAATGFTLMIFPILALWMYTEKFLLACGQEPGISALAGTYVRWAAPTLFPYLYSDIIKRYLQSQAITRPQIYIAILANILHAALCWLLVFKAAMGMKGAPLAYTLTWVATLVMYLVYIRWGNVRMFHTTCPSIPSSGGSWCGGWRRSWRLRCSGWRALYALGLPGCAMLVVEWGSFEVVSIASGWIGRLQLDTLVLLSNITVIAFMVPLALSISASTLVGNALGAGQPTQARLFARASLCVVLIFVLIELVLVASIRGSLARMYTSDQELLESFNACTWYLLALMPFDAIQCVQAGVIRGLGWQSLGARTNFVSYYFLGLPISFALAFWEPLGKHGLPGLLVGMVVAVMTSAVVFTYKLRSVNWEAESSKALERVEEERRAGGGTGTTAGTAGTHASIIAAGADGMDLGEDEEPDGITGPAFAPRDEIEEREARARHDALQAQLHAQRQRALEQHHQGTMMPASAAASPATPAEDQPLTGAHFRAMREREDAAMAARAREVTALESQLSLPNSPHALTPAIPVANAIGVALGSGSVGMKGSRPAGLREGAPLVLPARLTSTTSSAASSSAAAAAAAAAAASTRMFSIHADDENGSFSSALQDGDMQDDPLEFDLALEAGGAADERDQVELELETLQVASPSDVAQLQPSSTIELEVSPLPAEHPNTAFQQSLMRARQQPL